MIPHLIHQTWKTKDIPTRFVYLRDTWIRHHPDWQYRLWTDADNRAFLAENYPAFLPIFDAYQTPICRADAIRYFLLKHFGGLYVDLDFECFQPLDDILASEHVILGREPEAHVRDQVKLHQGITQIVCNALMASPAGHPFWDHVVQAMVAAQSEPGPLDATGPFVLTRAVQSWQDSGNVDIDVLPASVFYPADVHDGSEGRLFDLENWQRASAGAHAMHHWAGSWWRDAQPFQSLPSAIVRLALTQGGKVIAESALQARQCPPFGQHAPLVSCLMVTRNRCTQAICAVNSFRAQSYPARELVIIDDGQETELEAFLSALADPTIRYLRLPDNAATLGTLRNQAVALARGAYVCQWDDDDLADPARLSMQMTAMAAMQADACFLNRWVIWWPRQKRLALSTERVWEGSILCLKAKLVAYPTLRRGEDTPVADHILHNERVVLLDQARLYVYVVHQDNTFDTAHFEPHWQAASLQFTGAAYDRVMQELGKRLDLAAYEAALANKTDTPPRTAGEAITHEPAELIIVPAKPVLIAQQKAAVVRLAATSSELPTVLILTPVKNAAQFMRGYFEQVIQLEYPRGKLALALLEGDSTDGTDEVLQDYADHCRSRFASIELLRQDYAFQLVGNRWAPEQQFSRRSVISKCRNKLFKLADQGADYVLWIDADVIAYPADVLLRLLETNQPIVVPNCVQTPGGPTFDLNSFKFKPGASHFSWSHMMGGIIQPPRGVGRLYLDDFRGQSGVALDGVGGTMLLVRAELHRQGILFPDYSYRGYLDTEGFALHAKDRGFTAWGLPDLEIVHAPQ